MAVLLAENGKPALQLYPGAVRYLMSDGNYVEVFYYEPTQGLQKKLIRNRLGTLKEMLPEAEFFACHKRFVVNLSAIREVRGNARNLEIRLEEVPDWIPVSRSQVANLQTLIQSSSQAN
ncbi:MAG TPA: hypothetical protein DCE41_06270 [Cytophagales bacterium]|nr:hypothetical protein [Cytophagales bacterium]